MSRPRIPCFRCGSNCATVLILFMALRAWSLDPGKQLSQYVLTNWTSRNGLPQNSVYAIAQTEDGYIWLGTEEGLARFDGIQLTVFDDSGPARLGNKWVRRLCAGPDNTLWVGTRAGLVRYRAGVFHTITTDDGLASDDIAALYVSRDGSVWIGTPQGLNRSSNGTIRRFTSDDGLPDNDIRSITEDRNGSVWVGTRTGLGRLQGDRFIAFGHRDGLPDGEIGALGLWPLERFSFVAKLPAGRLTVEFPLDLYFIAVHAAVPGSGLCP